MTAPGYLERLAARARGAASAAGGLHPRVPGRYEPAGLAGAQGLEVAGEAGLATNRRGARHQAEPPAEDWTGARLGEEPEWVERGTAPELGRPDRPRSGDRRPGATTRAAGGRTAQATLASSWAAGQRPAGQRAAAHRSPGSRPMADAPASSPADAPVDWAEGRLAGAATPGNPEIGQASSSTRRAAAVSRAAEPAASRPAATAGDEPPAQAPGMAASWREARQPPLADGAAGGVAPPPPAARPGAAAEVAVREIVVRPEAGPAAGVTAEAEAPVIEVTIGRVEVRAAPAGEDPRRRRARERERPPMPLDEYLRRRRGRR